MPSGFTSRRAGCSPGGRRGLQVWQSGRQTISTPSTRWASTWLSTRPRAAARPAARSRARFVDLLGKEVVERGARGSCAGSGGVVAGQHVQAPGARARRAELEDAARATVSRPHEDLEARESAPRRTARGASAGACLRRRATSCASPAKRTSPSAAVTSVLPSPRSAARRMVRWLVAGRRRRSEAASVWYASYSIALSACGRWPIGRRTWGNLGEHRQLQEPAPAPRSTDPWLQLRGQNDEGRDEDRGEESEGRISEWTPASTPGSVAAPLRQPRARGACPSSVQVEIPDLRPGCRRAHWQLARPPALERGKVLLERGASPVQAAPFSPPLRTLTNVVATAFAFGRPLEASLESRE